VGHGLLQHQLLHDRLQLRVGAPGVTRGGQPRALVIAQRVGELRRGDEAPVAEELERLETVQPRRARRSPSFPIMWKSTSSHRVPCSAGSWRWSTGASAAIARGAASPWRPSAWSKESASCSVDHVLVHRALGVRRTGAQGSMYP
jgi:hypothetical protein